MKIFTSYYASKYIKPQKQYLVKISNSAPGNFRTDDEFGEVTPSWKDLVRPHKDGKIGDEEYIHGYTTQLNRNEAEILKKLAKILEAAEDKDVVLLCYEKPGAFCHRHILAKWLGSHTHQHITELVSDSELTLF